MNLVQKWLRRIHVLFIYISVCFCCVEKISAQSSPFIISDPIVYAESIESPAHDYIIYLGGTIDMDNSSTRSYSDYEVAFQPNISLEIENVGFTPVIDPWIVINDKRDWFDIDRIVAEATRGAIDEQDKLMLLYEFARSHRYHNSPLFPGDELHDPVKHFNSYGAGLCDDIGVVTCALAYSAGFTEELHGGDPMARSMHGHVMSEIAVNGHYQFIDTDENAFYLNPDNERAVSGDEIVRDSDLAARDYTYGPLFSSWVTGEKASSLMGRDDEKRRSITFGHEMHLTLRPKEKLTFRWDNIGKTPGLNTLKYYANSFLDYEPEMNSIFIENVHKSQGIFERDGILVGTSPDAFIIIEVKSPYVICGGAVSARFDCSGINDNPAVAVSVDGEQWSEIWNQIGKNSFTCNVSLDEPLGVKKEIPRYGYFIRINLASESRNTRLSDLKIHTDLLTSPLSLPRLSLGTNRIRYTDKNKGNRQIKVTHTFQESGNIKPPRQPELVYPADREFTDDAWIEFKWKNVAGAEKYHLRVSRRSDLRTSYRPCFDVIIDRTTFGNPRTGLFNPGETYYWSVRARNSKGNWGKWSPTQTFSWNGPRPPVNLKTIKKKGKIYLSWEPNPRESKPVQYEIYASNIKGFKPRKTPHILLGLDEVQSNLAAVTTETELLIVSSDPADRAPNKSSYRIIAIDENGTPGGSSWPLELDHPLIYSQPLLNAKVGILYEYRVLTLRSLGDLQYRYEKPVFAFWEKEGYEFSLAEAPEWIRIDSKTGIIAGKPSTYNTGKYPIRVTVNRTWPYEVTKTIMYQGKNKKITKSFLKDGPEFRASDEQFYILNVIR